MNGGQAWGCGKAGSTVGQAETQDPSCRHAGLHWRWEGETGSVRDKRGEERTAGSLQFAQCSDHSL